MRRLELEGPRGLSLRCGLAERRRERTRGLTGVRELAVDVGLLIPGATSVHTFGMLFPILVARLDESLRVVDVRRVPPRRLVLPTAGARHVLEGSIDLDLRVGDVVRPRPAG